MLGKVALEHRANLCMTMRLALVVEVNSTQESEVLRQRLAVRLMSVTLDLNGTMV